MGRDYRFYANILYDGSTYNGHVMDIHYTREGNNEIPGEDLTAYGTSTTAAVTRTGYYMGKFVNENNKSTTTKPMPAARITSSGVMRKYCWIMQK